ncbi:hypothetical protein [Halocatena marina]|uniref:hypothetical protein n=1 Tax=Halocatena marina TaxID=2934937 RepID=UPI00200DC8AD|nr:hypothetical protein [Halocatena marina]
MTSVVDAELGEQQFSRRTVLKLGGAAALGSPFLIGHASGASRKSAPPVYFDRQYDVSSTNGAFPMGLAETAAGGFMIAGFRVHSSNWLVKTKPNGRWLWTRSLHHWPDGSVYPFATPRDIIPAHGSGFIAVGSSREHPQEGGKSHRGFWIQKFTDTNEHVWFRDFGHGFRVAHSVARAPDGGYVIVGSRIDSDLDENVAWLVKTDEHGHKQWTRTYHHQGSASGYKIVALPQGLRHSRECFRWDERELGFQDLSQRPEILGVLFRRRIHRSHPRLQGAPTLWGESERALPPRAS